MMTTTMTPTTIALDKATLVLNSEFGMGHIVIHVRDLIVEVEPYAQYRNAIKCAFVPKGKRNRRDMWQTYAPSLVVLDGHVEIAKSEMFGPAETTSSGVTIQRGRASSFDPLWGREADDAVSAAVSKGARIVADYRGFKTL